MIRDDWWTVEEIAKRLKVGPAAVRSWLREGLLRGHNFGGRTGYRISEGDLNAFLAGKAAA